VVLRGASLGFFWSFFCSLSRLGRDASPYQPSDLPNLVVGDRQLLGVSLSVPFEFFVEGTENDLSVNDWSGWGRANRPGEPRWWFEAGRDREFLGVSLSVPKRFQSLEGILGMVSNRWKSTGYVEGSVPLRLGGLVCPLFCSLSRLTGTVRPTGRLICPIWWWGLSVPLFGHCKSQVGVGTDKDLGCHSLSVPVSNRWKGFWVWFPVVGNQRVTLRGLSLCGWVGLSVPCSVLDRGSPGRFALPAV
jgi:hypothetical protein